MFVVDLGLPSTAYVDEVIGGSIQSSKNGTILDGEGDGLSIQSWFQPFCDQELCQLFMFDAFARSQDGSDRIVGVRF